MQVLRFLAVVSALILPASLCSAQYTKKALAQQADYNIIQGRKAYYANDVSSAVKYFERAAADDPSNGYACFYWAEVLIKTDIDKAVEQFRRAIDSAKGDYSLIARSCHEIIKIKPDVYDAESIVKKAIDASKHLEGKDAALGQMALVQYLSLNKRDKAAALQAAKESLRIWPFSSIYNIIAGQLALYENRYNEAVDYFQTASNLSSEWGMPIEYVFALMGKRQWREAVDGLLDIYEDGGSDYKIARQILTAEKELPSFVRHEDYDRFYILAELLARKRMAQQPNKTLWPALLGDMKMAKYEYEQAVPYYRKAAEADPYYLLGLVYSQIGMKDYAGAASSLDDYISKYPSYANSYKLRADCREKLSMPDDSVLTDLSMAVKLKPGYDSFQSRAWFESMHGRQKEAILDYFMALQYDPSDSYSLLQRGVLFSFVGEAELAKSDLEAALRLSKDQEQLNIQSFALARLGRADEAEKVMLEEVKNAQQEGLSIDGEYYDLACLYSIINKPNDCLDALRLAFKNGYDNFNHARTDFDLENIRTDVRFSQLVDEFESKWVKATAAETKADANAAEVDKRVIEVPFVKDHGVLSVRCLVNGLPLSFVFDSGASDVSISRVEANFMVANGYISKSDFGDKSYYTVADGSVSVGTALKLRTVTFGGETLHDVWASVVDGQNSPLLLGQTVLSRLGKVEIDYEKQVIRFYR